MTKQFFYTAGGWNEPLGRTRSVDMEFHIRCIMHPPIGVVCAPVVGIRKHGANFSGDPLINELGGIQILKYVLEHHPAARMYEKDLRDQIVLRSAQTAELAFELCDLTTTRKLFKDVPKPRQSRKQRLKNAISTLPLQVGELLCKGIALAKWKRLAHT